MSENRRDEQDQIIRQLREVWSRFPRWRLGQLISNLQGPGPQDVFHLSDDKASHLLQGMLINEESGR